MTDRQRLVIDISLWDDHLDVPLLKEVGVAGVIVKSGSGMRRDPKFVSHAQAVVDGGLILMAYHWDDLVFDPAAQARWVVEDINATGLPVKFIWVDQEQWWTDWDAWLAARRNEIPYSAVPRASANSISQHSRIFQETLNGLYPQSGVYSNYGFVTTWAPSIKEWLGLYPVWAAHWGKQPKVPMDITWETLQKEWLPDYPLLVPPGAKEELIVGHQFTGEAFRLPGVYDSSGHSKKLDISLFSEEFLDVISDGQTPPKPPAEDTPVPSTDAGEFYVNVPGLNVRKGPGTQYDIVGILSKNTTVNVIETQGNWAHLDNNTWVYAPYLSAVVTTPPVDPTPSDTPAETHEYYVNVGGLNVRKGPGTQFEKVGLLSKNTNVRVVEIQGEWAHLDNDTWVYAPYLSLVGTTPPVDSTPSTPPAVANEYYVNVVAVNVRKGPGTQFAKVGILNRNTNVSVVEIQGEWAHLDNNTWIYAPYLTLVGTVQSASSGQGTEYYVNVPAVNVRKGPGTQHDLLGTKNKNTKVRVVEIQGYWAHLNNETWIYAPYLTKVG